MWRDLSEKNSLTPISRYEAEFTEDVWKYI
jgi:hypothetical protein